MKKLIGLVLIASTLSGCGYQGWMRYPCQEFENWENAECNPPQCLAVGQCTKDLIPDSMKENYAKNQTNP
jgi:hypothetical protein